jgi:hypothetical protein
MAKWSSLNLRNTCATGESWDHFRDDYREANGRERVRSDRTFPPVGPSKGPSGEILRPLFFLQKEQLVVAAVVELVGNKGSCALSISWFLIRQWLGDQDVRMPNAPLKPMRGERRMPIKDTVTLTVTTRTSMATSGQ